MSICLAAAALAVCASPAAARAGQLKQDRVKARELARQIAALDARIEVTVQAYGRATAGLDAVRAAIRDNRRAQRIARLQLEIARGALVRRAETLYKRGDITALDALFSADDFQQFVGQVTLVRRVGRTDRDVLRAVIRAERELKKRSAVLAADEHTAQRLVAERSAELQRIRSELQQRRKLLAGVKTRIARLAAARAKAESSPRPAVEPPSADGATGGGGGPWWPLIKSAAAAQGVSARGMYRLMMIESGGSATAVGSGGFHGLFQYAPATWKGSWNPYRGAGIYDGSAQIRATALAIHLGYGHAWWDPSYSWAFGD